MPADTSKYGPWPIGTKTIMLNVGQAATTPMTIWYPAQLGSDAGKTPQPFDPAAELPSSQAGKIPASDNKIETCDGSECSYPDLPIDTSHGPYPLVIFVHGTASFRFASLSQEFAWASRGFIAVAADHFGLDLHDVVGNACGGGTGVSQDITRDVNAIINGFKGGTGDYAFWKGSVDMTRIGLGGHSQGAGTAVAAANSIGGIQVVIGLADFGGVAATNSAVKNSLFGGGANDSVVSYSTDVSAYNGSSSPIRRTFSITNGNHLDVTDLCWATNAAGMTAIQVANKDMVCPSAIGIINTLAQCGTVMPVKNGALLTNYMTTAALEETLHCQDRSAAFSAAKTTYPQLADFQHKP